MGHEFKMRYKNAKVFARVLPLAQMPWQHVKILDDKKTIYVRCLQDFGVGQENCIPSYWNFTTDRIFYNESQNEIYSTVMDKVLETVLQGNNAIIFSYGQTGTGKSLTLSGLQNTFEDRGMAPRIIADLFSIKAAAKPKVKMCIQMSYIEATRMHIIDLLGDQYDLMDMHQVKNIVAKKMKTELHALKTLFEAEGRRDFTKGSQYNSHLANGVLTLRITTKHVDQTNPVKVMSKIHLVDLAGVDTGGNLASLYKNEFEIGNANLAKSQLEQFLLILCENQPLNIHVKQRLCILVNYLSDSLNAHSILRFIGHIRTTKEDLLISLSVLRFGQIVRGLPPQKLKPNISENEDTRYEILLNELNRLKTERDLNAMLMNTDLSTNITQDRIKHMQNVADEYLHNKTNEIVLLNVTDANAVIKVFKTMYDKLELEKIESTKQAYQKAYDDAVVNLKMAATDSLLSVKGRKSSKKSSIKSKDSSLISSSQKTGKKSLDRTSRSLSPEKVGDKLIGSSNKLQERKGSKRSKTGSMGLPKKSSTSRRKSNASTATAGDGSTKEAIMEEPIFEEIPFIKFLPNHEEAWRAFIIDEEYHYAEIIEQLETAEVQVRAAHKDYLYEVKNLQENLKAVETRRNEYMKAQLHQHVVETVEYDEEDQIVLTELEKDCFELLEKEQAKLVIQQERVLKYQAQLRIYMDHYDNVKDSLKESFENFCRDKFQTYIPNLEIEEESLNIKEHVEVKSIDDEEDTKTIMEKFNNLMIYDNLKDLMKKQAEKKIRNDVRHKEWVQSIKK